MPISNTCQKVDYNMEIVDDWTPVGNIPGHTVNVLVLEISPVVMDTSTNSIRLHPMMSYGLILQHLHNIQWIP